MSKVIDEYAVAPVGRIRAVTADTPGRAGIEAVRGRRSILRLDERGDRDISFRWLKGDRTVIEVERAGILRSLASLTFGGDDGSLLVHFPYFGATRAVFANLTLKERTAAGFTYEFQSDRLDVDAPEDLKGFKLSYKATTGYVDFNRHRDIDSKACGPWRRSFPLATESGRVAEVSVFEPEGLRAVKSPKSNDVHVQFQLDRPWDSLGMSIRWESVERISNRTTGAGPVGPVGVADRPWGSELIAFIKAPAPHQDRVAVVAVTPLKRPSGGDVMVVMAGFEHPDLDAEKPGVCLGAMYVRDAPAAG